MEASNSNQNADNADNNDSSGIQSDQTSKGTEYSHETWNKSSYVQTISKYFVLIVNPISPLILTEITNITNI